MQEKQIDFYLPKRGELDFKKPKKPRLANIAACRVTVTIVEDEVVATNLTFTEPFMNRFGITFDSRLEFAVTEYFLIVDVVDFGGYGLAKRNLVANDNHPNPTNGWLRLADIGIEENHLWSARDVAVSDGMLYFPLSIVNGVSTDLADEVMYEA